MPVQSCVRVIPEVCWLRPWALHTWACSSETALLLEMLGYVDLVEILAQSHYGLPKISQRSMWERPCNNM